MSQNVIRCHLLCVPVEATTLLIFSDINYDFTHIDDDQDLYCYFVTISDIPSRFPTSLIIYLSTNCSFCRSQVGFFCFQYRIKIIIENEKHYWGWSWVCVSLNLIVFGWYAEKFSKSYKSKIWIMIMRLNWYKTHKLTNTHTHTGTYYN